MDKKIAGILKNFHSDGLFVSPNIPTKKIENAFAHYGIPTSAEVFGIVDATVFGSAKNGLAFTSDGLFWKNSWTTDSAKNQMSWDELFSTAQARRVKGQDLLLGNGCVVGLAGSSMKPKVLLLLLEKLTKEVKPIEGNSPETIVQPAETQTIVADDDVAVGSRQSAAVVPEPVQKPPFDGSYQQEHLLFVNAVAQRHRLSDKIQVAPAIKIYKVEKIIEISAGRIKPYDILMIADNTFLQTAKDFLVVTAQAIWAKGTLLELEHFPIKEIRSIRCKKKNLYINDYNFQFFDQFSENEVLVMTNMLKELVVVLGKLAPTPEAENKPLLPNTLEAILSDSYHHAIADVVSDLQMEERPEGRQLLRGTKVGEHYL